jgi:hypothetical protein
MAKLDGLINDLIREWASKYDWPSLTKRQVITTSAGISEGTLSLIKGSQTITFSSAPVDSINQWALIVDGNEVEDAIYRISEHDALASTATLETGGYTGSTNTEAGYHLYKDEYDLPADTGKVHFVQRYGYPQPVKKINWTEMLAIKAYDRSEGPPQLWSVHDFDTTGDSATLKQIIFHPFPDDTYRLEIHSKIDLATEYSGSSPLPIPDDYLHVIEWGVLAHGYPIFLNDTVRGTYYLTRYIDALNIAVAQARDEEGGQPQTIIQDQYRSFYKKRRRTAADSDLGSYFGRLPNNS